MAEYVSPNFQGTAPRSELVNDIGSILVARGAKLLVEQHGPVHAAELLVDLVMEIAESSAETAEGAR